MITGLILGLSLGFLYEYFDRSCDELKLRVNLGAEANAVSATVQRMYYSDANGEWRPAQSAWWPDHNRLVRDGLSGYTHELTWDDVWPNNYWLVADGVSGAVGASEPPEPPHPANAVSSKAIPEDATILLLYIKLKI